MTTMSSTPRSVGALKTVIGRQLSKKLNVGEDVMQMIFSYSLKPLMELDALTDSAINWMRTPGSYGDDIDLWSSVVADDVKRLRVSIDFYFEDRLDSPNMKGTSFYLDGASFLQWTGEGREDQDQFSWYLVERTGMVVHYHSGMFSMHRFTQRVKYTWKELKARMNRIESAGATFDIANFER